MTALLPFIIGGLATGSVYGLAAVGLVVTYKASGIFNLAHGSLATVSAFLFYTLRVQYNMPWVLAALISVVVVGPLLGVIFEYLGRSLASAGLAVRVVGTLGVVLIVQAAIVLIYGTTTTRVVPQYLPQASFTVDGTPVTAADVIIFAIGLIATGGLYIYFHRTRSGLAVRAVVDSPELLDVAGTNPVVVRRRAWIIGVTFASLSGVLVAPLLSAIDATTLTLLIVTAFGAAALGVFSNLGLTYLGGLVIGLAGSISTKYFVNGLLSQLSSAIPFIVLFIVLLVSPRWRLADRSRVLSRYASNWRAPWQVQALGGAAVLAVLLFVPQFSGIHLFAWTTFVSYIILFLSLGLLVRSSGQVSLCHTSFLAIGVAAFSHLAVGQHLPWGVALLLSGLIAVPVGCLLAIPAIRLSSLYLALATLGFGIVLQYMFYTQSYMFGAIGFGLSIPRPHLSWLNLSSDEGYYYLVLALAVLTTLLILALNRSRLGRLLRAVSENPKSIAASGASINVTRVLVFCLSAFLAAIAGALAGGAVGVVSGDSYPAILGLTYFTVIMISVGTDPWYAILAAAGLALVPSYITSANTTNYLTLIFGISAVLYALTPDNRRGVPEPMQAALDRIFRRPRPAPAMAGQPAAAVSGSPAGDSSRRVATAVPAAGSGDQTWLDINGLTVRFGGLLALDNVSMSLPAGQIVGLIGPNGAGKTTLFNAASGHVRATSGEVLIRGHKASRMSPARRARLGLGRTFQQTELFEGLTVRDNVALGREAAYASTIPLNHVFTLRSQKREIGRATNEALRLCGLGAIADVQTSRLTTGQRRLLELGRCLAGEFDGLLLDEPSAGLDSGETAQFAEVLRRVSAERGTGVLLVEHDMSLVTTVCSYIYVLDFGRLLFEGTPAEVIASPVVKNAYLGGEETPESAAVPGGGEPMLDGES
jgi:ABC-type branched-subunit amino acid transport system ATPase component/branched-subunit amino acid ABC-type transport system permease component